ncbi:MAG: hypothetical protein F4X02_09330 [Chloroflexi bacterium]|nr:hypothetical protein [Chloroflexota bacterium]
MLQPKLRFYLDENMDPEIAEQLRQRGIDVLAARDVDLLSVSDGVQLRYAVADGRVLCTKDAGFTDPTTWDLEHYGIVFFTDSSVSIGYAVNALQDLYRNETPENMKNSLRYM